MEVTMCLPHLHTYWAVVHIFALPHQACSAAGSQQLAPSASTAQCSANDKCTCLRSHCGLSGSTRVQCVHCVQCPVRAGKRWLLVAWQTLEGEWSLTMIMAMMTHAMPLQLLQLRIADQ